VVQGIAALCASHPGPAPLLIEWSDGNGTVARLRARRLRVALDDEFLAPLRELTGPDLVTLVKVR
jgi:hypothetical protein